MTVREIVETLGLAADEDAVRKMAEYNAMVIAMSRKMNLTGIKDAEESLVKNIYDSLTVYEEKYFPKNGRMLGSELRLMLLPLQDRNRRSRRRSRQR